MPPRPRRWQVDAALISIALIWGTTFVLVKEALDDISTLLFLTLRFSMATAALALLFGRRVRTDLRAHASVAPSIRGGLLAGAFLFAGYVLQTFGLKYTTASKAGFLTGLYIPLVPLLGAVVYKKFPQTAECIGVLCAFLGMALMTVQRDIFSIGSGDLLVVACALAYAFHILILGHFAQGASIPLLTVVQIATAALLGAATFWWAEPARVRWSPGVWLALGITSLLATAMAFALQTWAQQYSSPARTALIFSLEPVFALVTSFVLLGERLPGRGLAGAGLILGGILLVELKPLRAGQHPS